MDDILKRAVDIVSAWQHEKHALTNCGDENEVLRVKARMAYIQDAARGTYDDLHDKLRLLKDAAREMNEVIMGR